MGFSLAKLSDFFGLEEEETFQQPQPTPVQKKVSERPSKAPTPQRQERVTASRPTYQRPVGEASKPVEKAPRRNAENIMRQAETAPRKSEKVVSMPNNNRAQRFAPKIEEKTKSRISVLEPRAYSEAMTIAKRIGQGEVVLINFQSLDEMKARRVVDFLTGAVFMIDGDIKRVGNEMFLCTPTNVEIDNSTLSSIMDEDIFGLEM